MGVLHFRITKKDQNIDMSRTLHAQNLTLRRAVVTRNRSIQTNTVIPPATLDNTIATYTTDYKGGIILDISFFKGFEILSNFSSNDILVPFGNAEANIDSRFEQNFASEDISLSFRCRTYDFKREDNVVFQDDTTALTDAAIAYVDLFFEFDEIHDYNTY